MTFIFPFLVAVRSISSGMQAEEEVLALGPCALPPRLRRPSRSPVHLRYRHDLPYT